MERKIVDLDDMTYEIHYDATDLAKGNKKYYIRASKPFCYVTDCMSQANIQLVAKSMRQMGFTVVDRSDNAKLTELEKDWLGGFAEATCMYVCHIQGYTSKIKTKQISGVVSSLVKKGLIETGKHDGLEINQLTVKGMQIRENLK